MSEQVYYNIANLNIKIISDLPFPFYAHNAEEFRSLPTRPDYTFRFQQVNSIPDLLKDTVPIANLIWAHQHLRTDGTQVRAFLWQENYYIAVTELKETEGICYYVSPKILAEKANEGFELLMYLCMEEILLKFNCLVLHSSHLDVNGKALLFSAPCGTGKSTQAELWEKYSGARIINGDRTVLRKVEDVWTAFGCPMCGTSNIHHQSCEPLSNIVLLSKAPENNLLALSGRQAFRKLYPEITVPSWDSVSTSKAIDLLTDIINSVPIWDYSCTKEPDAVIELKNSLRL